MKIKYICVSFFMVFACWVNMAFCATSTYTYLGAFFSYNIVASSCTVNIHNVSFEFYMNAADFESAGSSSKWQALPGQTIKLLNCFNGTSNVIATVSGATDPDDVDGFKNQKEGEGAATGVSVQLKSGEVVLHNNDVLSAKVTSAHTAEIPLAARLYSAHGNATAGGINSVINLTLSYK